jgi:non-canonical (house-cleaning) NTP pyrophosphatase
MIMTANTRDFWRALQTGVEVAVASSHADKLFGVRDGFLRFFEHRLGRAVPVLVMPQSDQPEPSGLPLTEEETLGLARQRALGLEERLRNHYHFFVGTEGGLHTVEIEGRVRYFIRNWTYMVGPFGEASGGSSSVQLPMSLVEGLGDQEIPSVVPATRRQGGMVQSLTGGLESRRSTVSASTRNALSTLFYGLLERPHPSRRRFR